MIDAAPCDVHARSHEGRDGANAEQLSEQAWVDRYAYRLDDVRFALEVCLAEQADAKTAASLVTASAPLWYQVSQVEEYRGRVSAALKLVESSPSRTRKRRPG